VRRARTIEVVLLRVAVRRAARRCSRRHGADGGEVPVCRAWNGAVVAGGDQTERAAANVPVEGVLGRPVGVNGSAGRPPIPRPPSWRGPLGSGGAAAPARESVADRHRDGWSAPPPSGDGGSYGSWSWSSTRAREHVRSRRVAGWAELANGVDGRGCVGGSHQGPPIPLRQRRDWTPRWRPPRRYAHPGHPTAAVPGESVQSSGRSPATAAPRVATRSSRRTRCRA
jgi:hypothetical protein